MKTLVAFALLVLLSFLMAYPTMWIINGIFAPSLLVAIFGATKIGVWTAWGLNVLFGSSTSDFSSEKK